jgi:hypothetical protein
VQSGKIGKIARVEMAVNFHEAHRQRDLTNVKQEDVDWEAFQFGGRITGPFDPRKLREWQLFRETTNGIAGLWMSHPIDLAPWYLLWKDGRQNPTSSRAWWNTRKAW